MQVTETKNEGLSREFSVVIPQAHLAERLNAKLEEIKPQVHLKGFRPGKAPTSFLKKLYGRNLMGELIQEEMAAAEAEALKGVQPATQPHPHIKDGLIEDVVEGRADLEYHMHFDVLPSFEPKGLDEIKLEKKVAEVPADEVEAELQKLADQNRSYKDLPKNRNVKEGHKVTIDFKGKVDGEYFEGGAGEDVDLVIGSGSFIPGFEEQLIGAKKDEEKVITVTFPEDYPAEHLAGKEAEFEVTIKENREPEDAEVNDDLAKQLGFDDLEALRGRITEMLQSRYNSQSRLHMKRALLDYLDEKHDFELPPAMVDAEFNQIWQQVQATELDDEDKEKSEDELRADYRRIAERRVRLGLLLAEIGKRNNVQVPQDELSRAIQANAMQMGMQPQQLFELIRERPDILAQIRAPLFEEKVVDHLIEKAEVTEKTVSKDELMAEPGE